MSGATQNSFGELTKELDTEYNFCKYDSGMCHDVYVKAHETVAWFESCCNISAPAESNKKSLDTILEKLEITIETGRKCISGHFGGNVLGSENAMKITYTEDWYQAEKAKCREVYNSFVNIQKDLILYWKRTQAHLGDDFTLKEQKQSIASICTEYALIAPSVMSVAVIDALKILEAAKVEKAEWVVVAKDILEFLLKNVSKGSKNLSKLIQYAENKVAMKESSVTKLVNTTVSQIKTNKNSTFKKEDKLSVVNLQQFFGKE